MDDAEILDKLRILTHEFEKRTKVNTSASSSELFRRRGLHKDAVVGSSGSPKAAASMEPPSSAPGSAMSTTTTTTTTVEIDFERVDVYPHPSQPRSDFLDTIKVQGDIIDTLRQSEFEGVFNLSLLSLVFALLYNIVRSVTEHGNRVTFEPLYCSSFTLDIKIAAYLWIALASYSFVFFIIVKLMVIDKISERTLFISYLISQLILLVVPAVFIIYSHISPIVSLIMCMISLAFGLKCHSYVATNHHLKLQKKKSDISKKDDSDNNNNNNNDSNNNGEKCGLDMRPIQGGRSFPSNVNVINFFVFILLIPTLAYEPKFAPSHRIRIEYIVKKASIGCLLLLFMYADFMQFILPVLVKRDLPFYYALMKLGIPSFTLWLAGFYLLFNCVLNIFGELSFISDRQFYLDWWNTTSIESFWRKWNIPVHEWALRHVYVDLTYYLGLKRNQAMIATFIVSAVFHEYIFFVALNATTKIPWFFFGMLAQIPLVTFSRNYVGKRRGNLIMWFSLFTGQPLLELIYFRQWFSVNGDIFCVRGY